MLRALAKGRVSEVVGERGVEVDKTMRTLGLKGAAESLCGATNEQTISLL